MAKVAALLVLPRLRVQNANCISGPLTWGFPAPTAFLGFIHALQRCFAHSRNIRFEGVGIICHRFNPQVFKHSGGHTQVFRLTRNPVDKHGNATAFVEEGRAHMEVSLVVGACDTMTPKKGGLFANEVMASVESMRLAGGSILPVRSGRLYEGQWWSLSEDLQGQAEQFRKLRRLLLPGFALVHRPDYLADSLAELRKSQPQANALDALMDLSRLNIEPNERDPGKPSRWSIRRKPGWLVPLPVGYAALTSILEPGSVKGARSESTPFAFVESLYSLGEWLSPHRLTSLDQLLWYSKTDSDTGIYQCANKFSETASVISDFMG